MSVDEISARSNSKPSGPVPAPKTSRGATALYTTDDNNDEDDGDESDEEQSQPQQQQHKTPAVNEADATKLALSIAHQRSQKVVKLSPYCLVETAVNLLAQEFAIDPDKFFAFDYRLYKVARGGMDRQQLDFASNLFQCGIQQGDELRLKNTKEKGIVQISRPAGAVASANSPFSSFQYDFSTTVRQAIAALLKDSSVNENPEQYGLYYAAKGIWLDQERTLELYDIDPQHPIDLRKMSLDVLLKISVKENEMNLTFKVPKTSSIAEVNAMVTRRVNSETPYLYGLYSPQANMWLDESKTVQDYDLQNQSKLEYKNKFRQVTIVKGGDWGDTGTVANGTSESAATILVDLRATVSDIINLIRLNDALMYEEERHVLMTQNGEVLPMDMTANDLNHKDFFDLCVCPNPLYVTPAYDPSAKLAFLVDFTKPIKKILVPFIRRLGIQQHDFAELATVDGKVLDLERSLASHQVAPSSVVVLKAKNAGWEKQTSENSGGEDVNIWDESDANIQFEESPSSSNAPIIAAGSLNKLVEKLSDDKNHDLSYMKMFLLTYQSFTTPAKLMTKIGERYYVPVPKGMAYEDFERNVRRPIQLRVVNFLKQWLEKYSKDFYQDKHENLSEVGKEVLKFAREVLAVDDPKLAKQIISLFQKLRDGALQQQKDYIVDIQQAPMPRIPFVANPKLFQYHPEEIARQLTLIEFDLFAAIKPSEFLNQNWNKKTSAITSANILNISARFNKMVLWVIRAILSKKEIKKRAQRMTKIIDIAWQLYLLHNFSTLMAFVAGLNAAAVTRLKHTKAELNKNVLKNLETLEKLMSAESSYKQYRAEIHKAEPPIIPYIGVYLADLTFIDDGNPDKLNGLINFSKRRLDYSVISEIQLYQNKPFNLRDYPELRMRLQDLPDPKEGDDKELYDLSLQLEPRGAERNQIL